MRHLRERYLPVAIVSGVAAAVAAGAFGLSAASAGDPDPIVLDGAPAAPDALVAPEATGASVPPFNRPVSAPSPTSTVSPVSPDTPPSPPSPASPASPYDPPSPPSPASPDSPEDPPSPPSPDSPDSPDSPPSAASIDS